MNELIEQKLSILPDMPGCYLMKDRQGTIIYVGKAKVLKKRVRSYFTGTHDAKTQRLVGEIDGLRIHRHIIEYRSACPRTESDQTI